ncbi:MerR family transcriptional regulator [Arthrobacter sp. H20]|uniref:MerR family transcriptional regulator n=1 Tax=Arthrobacter sp. H20 TaxID=1267981 RepID=UPI00047E898E|nr:MerR family transcriptional regulator [Arthrobacter sp. H20]
MDWPIQKIARLTGTTSRTLRHYGDVGLLVPSRIGNNGKRYYDDDAMVRLQRILMLRQLGLVLPAIASVLEGEAEPVAALHGHLEWLRQEQNRLARQITSVDDTVNRLEKGEELMAENMFDGFDHTQYKDEVQERWGKDTYAHGDAWWRAKSDAERVAFAQHAAQLGADWADAANSRIAPGSAPAQALAARHVAWLSRAPGVPSSGGRLSKDYVLGLGDLYVADPRFGKNYGGQGGAEFVRDALRVYADLFL